MTGAVTDEPTGSVTDPVTDLADRLAGDGYVADRPLAMVLHLAQQLGSPVLLEGEPGVGKTSVAEALAAVTGARLVRLQCYEGLTAQHALYEWDYTRQLLDIRLAEAGGVAGDELRTQVFSTDHLLRRPLLDAIWPVDDRPVVLLVDEVDRADEEFEALLLELLSQFQITIPEIGTITAQRRPTIVLTANRTRSLSDALRRRCLYHWLPFPGLDREIAILTARLPEASASLARQTAQFVQRLRAGHYRKSPGVSETLDWLRALTLLGATEIDPPRVADTLGVLLKDAEDLRTFTEKDGARVFRELGVLR
ncbi:MAG: ATPase associated with various cellular 5 [Modestobacter sp.]|nr:ATPase associated with various cellular 5 [Modestobacter sp.]